MWLEIYDPKGRVDVENLTSDERHHIICACQQLIEALEELDYNERLDELTEEELAPLVRCRMCRCYVNPTYGAEPPIAHQDASGTADDPRAPGDHNDICDVCDYA